MPDELLQAFVERAAVRSGASEAVSDGRERLSYEDLDRQSNRLARTLAAHGVGRGEHVILCTSRSAQVIAGMIGVLKADAVYVPILGDTPAARRDKIVGDCRPKAFIGDGPTLKRILSETPPAALPPVLVCLEPWRELPAREGIAIVTPTGVAAEDAGPLPGRNDDGDVACLLYTSGSTGTPKGVMLTHRNIREYAAWAVERIGIGPGDRVLSTAPFHFDMSLFDVYGTLAAGAALCIADEKRLLFPRLLVEFAEGEKVTIWKGVSSLLMYLARTGSVGEGRLPALRTVLFSGEVLPTKYLIQWMTWFPDKVFYNAYGPTEATGVSMYYRVPRCPASAEEKVPIGIPCENTEVFLLDEEGRPVPPGEPGELYIRGICVTKGYFNDPAKTAAVFSDDPANPNREKRTYRTGDHARLLPDGNYEFIGRRDNQIKYMGYRIELTDIEQALVSVPGVRDAGVVLAESAAGGIEDLVAYVELDETMTPAQAAAALKDRLPAYMVPKEFYAIARLPRSDRGKIDRKALLAIHRERAVRS